MLIRMASSGNLASRRRSRRLRSAPETRCAGAKATLSFFLNMPLLRHSRPQLSADGYQAYLVSMTRQACLRGPSSVRMAVIRTVFC